MTGLPPALELDTDYGRLFAHADDQVITPTLVGEGHIPDRDIAALPGLMSPGMTVIDVGANIGYTALLAARAVGRRGRVYAIEPFADNVWLLRANIALNGCGRVVQVVEAAAWDTAGAVSLALSDENTGDHRAGVDVPGRRAVTVPTVRLDDVVPLDVRVDVIKLDTQGTEHIALGGALGIVRRCAPVLITEFWPAALRERGDDPLEVLHGYTALGYALELLEAPDLPPSASEADVLAATERIPSPVETGAFGSLLMRRG
jgi:FkbM family methyltransferase